MTGVSPCGIFKLPGAPPLRRRRRLATPKAGLYFPVERMRSRMVHHASPGTYSNKHSAVYLATVLEYLTAEVMKLSGTIARNNGLKRITQQQIQHAIRADSELDDLVRATIEWHDFINHDYDSDDSSDTSDDDSDDDFADFMQRSYDSESKNFTNAGIPVARSFAAGASVTGSSEAGNSVTGSSVARTSVTGSCAAGSSATEEDLVNVERNPVTDRASTKVDTNTTRGRSGLKLISSTIPGSCLELANYI